MYEMQCECGIYHSMNLSKPRVAIYVRVSTTDQTCDLQKRELEDYIAARGWLQPKLYEDHGFTGTNGNRTALKQLLSDVRQRKLDVVCCWKMDRLFRSLKDLIVTIQGFDELGVTFVSLKDQVDLSTSTGRLMMQVVGAFSEFEASLIRERVRAGLANARARGKTLGRPITRNDSKILTLRNQGVSIRSIARTLHTSPSSVQRSIAKLPRQPTNLNF